MAMRVYLLVIIILIIIFILSKKRHDHKLSANHKLVINNLVPIIEQEQKIKQQDVVKAKPAVQYINKLMDDYRITRDPLVLVEIGDFYRKGMYSIMKSNNSEAIKFYKKAAASSNKQAADIAMGKYIEATIDTIPEIDDVGEELDEIPQIILLDMIQDDFDQEQIIPIAPVVPAEHEIFLNDLQNVHDHYMNKITQSNVDKLKEFVEIDKSLQIKEILKNELYKESKLDDHKKATIITIIDSFSETNEQFGITEVECLQLVYTYIQTRKDKSDLIYNLFLQLLDCMENSFIICTTGKISRVVSVVGDLNEFENARNIYYIKGELEQLAGKVRDEVLSTLSKEQIDAYNNGDNQITDLMKKTYMDRIQEEYCDKLHIDYKIIRPHVETNLAAF